MKYILTLSLDLLLFVFVAILTLFLGVPFLIVSKCMHWFAVKVVLGFLPRISPGLRKAIDEKAAEDLHKSRRGGAA